MSVQVKRKKYLIYGGGTGIGPARAEALSGERLLFSSADSASFG